MFAYNYSGKCLLIQPLWEMFAYSYCGNVGAVALNIWWLAINGRPRRRVHLQHNWRHKRHLTSPAPGVGAGADLSCSIWRYEISSLLIGKAGQVESDESLSVTFFFQKFLRSSPQELLCRDGASGLISVRMSRRSSLASLLLERLGEEQEEEEGKKAMPSMSMPFRVLGDEELPAWLGLPWSPKSWPPSSSSQVFVLAPSGALYVMMRH